MGRFFPKLKESAKGISIPSQLTLCCNTVELLRLRVNLLMV